MRIVVIAASSICMLMQASDAQTAEAYRSCLQTACSCCALIDSRIASYSTCIRHIPPRIDRRCGCRTGYLLPLSLLCLTGSKCIRHPQLLPLLRNEEQSDLCCRCARWSTKHASSNQGYLRLPCRSVAYTSETNSQSLRPRDTAVWQH